MTGAMAEALRAALARRQWLDELARDGSAVPAQDVAAAERAVRQAEVAVVKEAQR